MEFRLHIRLGNAAMDTGEDLASALTKLGEKLSRPESVTEEWDDYDTRGKVRDINGNTVGSWIFDPNA